jgi:hypothetical protein
MSSLFSLSGGRSSMAVGPSFRQVRHRRLPLCQGLPTGHTRCIQRTTDDDTDDLAAERKAELAPRGTYGRRPSRNASAAARVRRGRDDLLGDARDVLAVESAREGHFHRYGGTACADKFFDVDGVTGSTHTLSPRQFIDDLKVLDLSGVASRAVPNGLRELEAARPYQAFYDERYFTRDAPPPQKQQQQQTHKAPPMGKSVSARSVGRSGSGTDRSLSGSTVSVNSYSTNGGDKAAKEKKKRGFLGF